MNFRVSSIALFESGLRELCGEWVVGKKTWQRLQTEWKAGNHSHGPGEPKRKERVILYIHGGLQLSSIIHLFITPLITPF